MSINAKVCSHSRCPQNYDVMTLCVWFNVSRLIHDYTVTNGLKIDVHKKERK